jgi:hypothetical protein
MRPISRICLLGHFLDNLILRGVLGTILAVKPALQPDSAMTSAAESPTILRLSTWAIGSQPLTISLAIPHIKFGLAGSFACVGCLSL